MADPRRSCNIRRHRQWPEYRNAPACRVLQMIVCEAPNYLETNFGMSAQVLDDHFGGLTRAQDEDWHAPPRLRRKLIADQAPAPWNQERHHQRGNDQQA